MANDKILVQTKLFMADFTINIRFTCDNEIDNMQNVTMLLAEIQEILKQDFSRINITNLNFMDNGATTTSETISAISDGSK